MNYLFLQVFGHLETYVIWGYNDGSHQLKLAIRRCISSFGFGKRFQTACPLEYLGFWIPINSGAPYILSHHLAFSRFGVFLPALHFCRHRAYHRSLLFVFFVIGFRLASDKFLPRQRVFGINFGKFSIARSSFFNACYSFLGCIGCCLVRKKMNKSVSTFRVSQFLCSFWMLCLRYDGLSNGRIQGFLVSFFVPMLSMHLCFCCRFMFFTIVALERWARFFLCHWLRNLLCKLRQPNPSSFRLWFVQVPYCIVEATLNDRLAG